MPTDPPPPTPDEVLRYIERFKDRYTLYEDLDTGYSVCGPDLARQLLQTRDAMLDLMAEQNGPPLICYKAAWEAAMAKCRACLPAPAEAAPEPEGGGDEPREDSDAD